MVQPTQNQIPDKQILLLSHVILYTLEATKTSVMQKTGVIIVAMFWSAILSAQIITGQEVQERTEEKVQQRVNQRVDQSIDNGLDVLEGALFGRRRPKAKEAGVSEPVQSGASHSSSSPVPATANGATNLPGSYEFDVITVARMTSTNKRGRSESSQYEWLYSNRHAYFAMEVVGAEANGGASLMIFDMSNRQMVTLMESDGQKMAMVMPLDGSMYSAEISDDEPEQEIQGSFSKTGRTKQIAGYTCDEYTFSSEDAAGEVWISQTQDIKMGFSMGAFAASSGGRSDMSFPAGYPVGNVMEMMVRDVDGSTTHFETIEVKTNAGKSVSTAGYRLMNMGGFGR